MEAIGCQLWQNDCSGDGGNQLLALAMRSMTTSEVDKRKHPEVMAKRGAATVRYQQQDQVATTADTVAAGGHESNSNGSSGCLRAQ